MRWVSLFLSCLLLTSCTAPAPADKKVLRLNLFSPPDTLDPRMAYKIVTRAVILMLYDGLVRIDPEGKEQLALAESYTVSPDGLQYTFKLRNAYWSNGDPITAEDFVRTYQQIIHPTFPGCYAYQLYVLKNGRTIREGKLTVDNLGVRALDSRTLEFTLEHPTPYFLNLLTCVTYFPIHPFASLKSKWRRSPPPTSGPFTLQSWKHSGDLVVRKNPYYWDADAVKLDGINTTIIENEHTELYLVERNELDWAGSPFSMLPLDAIPTLRSKGVHHAVPMAAIYWYKLNTRVPPLTSAKVRRALSLAIDRDYLVKYVTAGIHTPPKGVVPPLLQGEPRHLLPKAEPGQAQQLFQEGLADLGLSLDTLEPIELIYNTGGDHQRIATAIAAEWERVLGFKVRLQCVEFHSLMDRLLRSDYAIARFAWFANFADEIDFLNVFRHSNDHPGGWVNDTHWTDPEFTALLDTADNTTDRTERASLLAQAETILMDAMPVIPLFYINFNYVCNPHLHGVAFSPMGTIDFKWASLDDELSP